jgi:hypothetical protein
VTDSRLGKIWELVAEQAADHATGLSAADACAAAVAGVQVTGGWLNAGADGNGGHLMQATDEVGRYLADLQLTLGEGPSFDAYSAGGPALASDLADEESGRRWPTFASAACQAGAAAVFAFPLAVGAIRAGVLSLYRDRPGALSARQLGDALLFADTATLLLLNAQANRPPAAKTNGEPADFSGIGWRSTRPPGCSPSSSASTSLMLSHDCQPMLVLTIYGWPMSLATSWPAACGCTQAPGRPRTLTRELGG